MTIREMKPGVYSVGAIDWERRVFDALVPLPFGTSYNSYLVQGSEKTALVDTVDPTYEEELIRNLVRLNVDTIDYVVVNHAEQDHSGSLPMILELFPRAEVYSTAKGRELLGLLLDVPSERCRVVKDGDTLSLGDRTLQFLETPWVHWPDTMLTYLQEDKVLFSGDFLGSHMATGSLYTSDPATLYGLAKLYYAEIMMPFRSSINTYLQRIAGMEIDCIAPSHGPVHDRPSFILDAYADWASDRVANRVVIPYTSMHGTTRDMVRYLTDALIRRAVDVEPLDLASDDTARLATAIVEPATIVIASPTVLFGPHPKVVAALYLINLLRPKIRYMSLIGSFGWGGATLQRVNDLLGQLKLEQLDPVLVKGYPREQDYQALERLADEIAEKHRALGIA